MNRLERAAVLLKLVEALRENGSWCGETHVQKATYFLQKLLQVPLAFSFILYKHGPYSFDLSDELTAMQAYSLLSLEAKPHPYGSSFCSGENAQQLMERFGAGAKRYAREIGFVAEKLGDKKVIELERLATALYVALEEEGSPNRASRINELKRHISMEEALQAVQLVDSITEEANRIVNACAHEHCST